MTARAGLPAVDALWHSARYKWDAGHVLGLKLCGVSSGAGGVGWADGLHRFHRSEGNPIIPGKPHRPEHDEKLFRLWHVTQRF